MKNELNIPISSTSLANIFAYGCILPIKFYKNPSKDDIQNHFDDIILMTSNKGCNLCNCYLQIVLTDEERKECIPIGKGYYLYRKPIPISRIFAVVFDSHTQKDSTITTIELSTAYVPKNILKIDGDFDSVEIPWENRPSGLNVNDDNNRKGWDKFNRFLGALSLMKTAKEDSLTHSARYIDTLSFFNSFIEQEKIKNSGNIQDTFHQLFTHGSKIFESIIDENFVNKYATNKGLEIRKKNITHLIDFDSISDPTLYVLSILCTFGCGNESKRKSINELILSNFQEGLKDDMNEAVAFYYGYNRGYAVFNNSYRKEGKEVIVKLKLDNLLDYYIIESIYNFAFNNKRSGRLPYIESWCNKQACRAPRKGEYVILDTIIRDKKKEKLFSLAWWKNFSKSFLEKDESKIIILNNDLTPLLIERILKPFSNSIKEDIKDEIEENSAYVEEQYLLQIEKLKKENESKDKIIEDLNSKQRSFINQESEDSVTKESFINNTFTTETEHTLFAEENEVHVNHTPFDSLQIINLTLSYKKLNKNKLETQIKEKGIEIKTKASVDDLVRALVEYDLNKN